MLRTVSVAALSNCPATAAAASAAAISWGAAAAGVRRRTLALGSSPGHCSCSDGFGGQPVAAGGVAASLRSVATATGPRFRSDVQAAAVPFSGGLRRRWLSQRAGVLSTGGGRDTAGAPPPPPPLRKTYEGRVVQNHSTHIEQLIPALKELAEYEGVRVITPGRLKRVRGHHAHLHLRVAARKPSGGVRLTARKGTTMQEVFVTCDDALVSEEALERAITEVLENYGGGRRV